MKKFLLAPFFVMALAVIGAAAALADSGTTQLSVAVPSSISMTGLALTYTASIPAGTTGVIDTPVTISTNNASGYTVTVAALSPNFHSTAGGYDMSISTDTLILGSTSVGPLTEAGVVVKNSSNPASGDVLAIHQSIAVPGNQPGATYQLSETFTAVVNP